MTFVVAIDGAAGVGKTTLARRLAATLGLPYVNTGLMYRAVTLEALRRGVDPDDEDRLAEIASGFRFDLQVGERPPELVIDGAPPEPELVSPPVEAAVSAVSAHPAVRAVLRQEQRRLSFGGGVVEGRDIGTVVRPDADVKLFLSARADERAARRAGERATEAETIGSALRDRDSRDARVNPLVPAADAIEITTSGKDAEAVYHEALAHVLRSWRPPA